MKFAAVAATLAVIAWWGPAGMAGADPTHGPGPTPGPGPAPTQASGGPKTSIDKDGTYAVGTDIAPGTYSSAGPIGDGACYWKRLSGDKIVDNAMTKKPQVVQIEPGDTAFKTNHCQPWHLTNCPPDCPPPSQPLPAVLLPGLLPGLPPG